MQKKLLFSIGLMAMALSGCETMDSMDKKNTKRKRHVVYHKRYETSPSLLEQIGDPKNFDSTAVYQKHVGKTFHDTFTKERGYSQSSHYNPADF